MLLGGKDSDCIRILAALAGVKCENTSQFNLRPMLPRLCVILSQFPALSLTKNVTKDGTPKTMWNLIPPRKKMPPLLALVRYCCSELKERGGKGRLKITGVRAAESLSRKVNGGEIKIILGKPQNC